MTIREDTELVTSFYRPAFDDGQPEQAAARAIGPAYRQHNPGAPDGVDAFVGYVHQMRAGSPS